MQMAAHRQLQGQFEGRMASFGMSLKDMKLLQVSDEIIRKLVPREA